MKHRIRVALAGLPVAFTLGLVAGCDGDDDSSPPGGGGTSSPGAGIEPQVSLDEAEAIALETVGGGQVREAEIDDVDDRAWVWEVTVVTSTGENRQVTVDATSGSVVGNVLDD